MKRSIKKIGKRTFNRSEERVTHQWVRSLSAILFILMLASCEKEPWYGRDGRPGDAYVALTWQVEEPTYIDAGTHAIPPVFRYGEYYKINPGNYLLYYEGEVWSGMSWAFYAWEVEYRIREVAGEPGGWHYHGADGPDSFFTLEMSPYGPYISESYKSSSLLEGYEMISDDSNEIVVKKMSEGYEMEVTFRKTASRKAK